MDVERRAHFRVDLFEAVNAFARIISINGKEVAVKKFIPLNIRDLSGGGMKICTELNLPVQVNFVLQVTFQFESEYFDVTARIIRYQDKGNGLKEYGLKFIYISRSEENRLVQSLNQYQMKQFKKKVISTGTSA